MAVKRLANVAVFGEAPEDLLFTLTDVDRAVNFSARTIGGCTSERTSPPPSSVSNDVHVNNFECIEALHALRLEVVQLEALTNAASEAVTQLPFPSDREERRIFDRVYALVTKVADETTALVAYGDELVAGLEGPAETPSGTAPASES